MGSLFGGYLSQNNEVYLIDVDQAKIDKIQRDGISIREKNGDIVFRPNAIVSSAGMAEMDLIIVFVKAMYSKSALAGNKHLIGKNTYVMTLQNGAGHEETLLEFVEKDHVVIGTTQHNSSIIETGYINHGGAGKSSIGLLSGNSEKLQSIATTFNECGFETAVSDDIKRQIWNKLFTNVSASVMTAILQVKLGFLFDNEHGWFLVERLIREAVSVAIADGIDYDVDVVIADVRKLLDNAREGYTSIYADIKNGVRTEVDTISGSIIRAAKRYGVSVPSHEFVVELVHAMEDKSKM